MFQTEQVLKTASLPVKKKKVKAIPITGCAGL
jgi:hypothetical protein